MSADGDDGGLGLEPHEPRISAQQGAGEPFEHPAGGYCLGERHGAIERAEGMADQKIGEHRLQEQQFYASEGTGAELELMLPLDRTSVGKGKRDSGRVDT